MFKDVSWKVLKTDVESEVVRLLVWFWCSEPLTALQQLVWTHHLHECFK